MQVWLPEDGNLNIDTGVHVFSDVRFSKLRVPMVPRCR